MNYFDGCGTCQEELMDRRSSGYKLSKYNQFSGEWTKKKLTEFRTLLKKLKDYETHNIQLDRDEMPHWYKMLDTLQTEGFDILSEAKEMRTIYFRYSDDRFVLN